MSNIKTAITPTREQDFPAWYQQVVAAADLAENSEVRGCMIIKPWGYGLWEQIQRQLDRMFKETGHENAYFPLFIPLSYLQQEAAHVAGFAKECAVVTHHRLEAGADGELVPTGELAEPLIVRPTSETIIGASFARWVQSYRDLPLLLNQWANVVRWELRPRLFLRTAEFLWQEGHTAHETATDAVSETERMLGVYETFARDQLALPVLAGEKSERERFPGAERTLCIEAMAQDRKAIQAGTSHFLGQNFARAAGIKFVGRDNTPQFAYTTSWGVSTRLIGALIMAHGDDNGVRLPPRVAAAQIVILPVTPKADQRAAILAACEALAAELRRQTWRGEPLRVKLDTRDLAGGGKTWDWIKKGAPLRVEIGPRDLASGSVFVGRRDRDARDRQSFQREKFITSAAGLLEEIQQGLYDRALAFREAHTRRIDTREEFYAYFTPQNAAQPEPHGGFALAHWGGDAAVEEQLKNDLKVTIRCIPFDAAEAGVCPFTGRTSKQRVVFAKSY
ncbi:MAG: proline--tRNA ligase [Verrucomicrobiales bacterium]|jgi:prolyl-tRNA synthetase|nr:proline--tRNA ligase [Verrucomicrobiales bacterium]